MTQYFQDAHAHDAERDVSLLAVDQYFREVKWIPPFAKGEEAVLFQCIAHSLHEPGNVLLVDIAAQARERLVEGYQKALVLPVVRKMCSRAHSMEVMDLVNEASIVLLALLDEFTLASDFTGRFGQFAFHRLVFALSRVLREQDDLVRLPDWARTFLLCIRRVACTLQETLGRVPTLTEIAREMGESVERLHDVVDGNRLRSLASLQGMEEKDESPEDRYDFVSLFAAQVQEDTEHQTAMAEAFKAAFASLRERERELVALRFGVAESVCLSITEIAERWGVVSRTAQGVQERALERLRAVLEPQEVQGVITCAVRSAFQEGYYTPDEAARVLGLKKEAFKTRVRRGHIPSERRPGCVREQMFAKSVIDGLAARQSASLPPIVA